MLYLNFFSFLSFLFETYNLNRDFLLGKDELEEQLKKHIESKDVFDLSSLLKCNHSNKIQKNIFMKEISEKCFYFEFCTEEYDVKEFTTGFFFEHNNKNYVVGILYGTESSSLTREDLIFVKNNGCLLLEIFEDDFYTPYDIQETGDIFFSLTKETTKVTSPFSKDILLKEKVFNLFFNFCKEKNLILFLI